MTPPGDRGARWAAGRSGPFFFGKLLTKADRRSKVVPSSNGDTLAPTKETRPMNSPELQHRIRARQREEDESIAGWIQADRISRRIGYRLDRNGRRGRKSRRAFTTEERRKMSRGSFPR